ncbi:SAC3 domain-containing protein 1 [Hyperolius riggenbachi]|uniref:SAC3 domain-containing protein 1 n=1 Tax=Hyperolius riggenbachi TaxID=752182 RepID=UPI0035A368A7
MDRSSLPPVGLCLDMCPEKERKEREKHQRLHPLEIQNGQPVGKKIRRGKYIIADPGRMVKEYSRPAAGKELSSPSELRPPATLLKTVHYLLMEIWENINERDLANVALAYTFVFDRLRAVRQDLTVQRIQGTEGAVLLEESLGFLLCAPYIVRQLPPEDYCEVLHATQLRESFAELMDCYRGCGKFPRQAEFQALLLLYDLGNMDAINKVLQLPHSIQGNPQVRLALAINKAFMENNWVRLFRLVRQLDCLQACAFHHHLTKCRDQALRTYTHGYSSRNCRFPLDHLAWLLMLDSPLTLSDMCQRRGLGITSGEKPTVLFLKSSFKDVELESPGKEIQLVEMKKKDRSWAEVMKGEEDVHCERVHF